MKAIKDLHAGDKVFLVYDNNEHRIGVVIEIHYPLEFEGRVNSCTFHVLPDDYKFTEIFREYGSRINNNYFYPSDLSDCIAYLEKEDAIQHIKDSIKTALKSIDELSAL